MENYRKYALAIFFLIAFTELHGQLNPRYIFGVNLSTMKMRTRGLSSQPEMPAGIHFGGSIEIPVAGNLSFQPALMFSAKGTNYKIDSTDIALSPIYIEIPANAVLSFGKGISKLFIFAGPYFGIGIGGYKLETGKTFKYLSYGSGDNKDLKQIDAGFNFGAGVSISGFIISAQYGTGLTNISPVTSGGSEMKNKVIGISISSLFPRRQPDIVKY
jgi:hypothetical protein